jgi:hypothetical protein
MPGLPFGMAFLTADLTAATWFWHNHTPSISNIHLATSAKHYKVWYYGLAVKPFGPGISSAWGSGLAMKHHRTGKTRCSMEDCGQLIMSPAGVGLLIDRLLEHPPLIGALSTVDGGRMSRVRMVVIREFDIRTMCLQISADLRSAKIRQLRAHPKAELCLWLADLATQLRLMVSWRVITADIAIRKDADYMIWHKLWHRHSAESRQLFIAPPPGRPVALRRQTTSNKRDMPNPQAGDPADDTPPKNFTVLLGTITAIDALMLAEPTHQRYRHRHIADHWETLKLNA